MSLYQLRAELLDLPAVWENRLAAERVDALDGRRARAIEAELTELASLGSFRLTKSPWARSPITDPGEVTRAAELLERFRTESLPQTWRQLAEATAALGLNAPSRTVSGWRRSSMGRDRTDTPGMHRRRLRPRLRRGHRGARKRPARRTGTSALTDWLVELSACALARPRRSPQWARARPRAL